MRAPGLKYGVILADSPWTFQTRSPKGEGRSPKYRRMGIAEIAALPVADFAADNCALFLWANGPRLPEMLTVIGGWGFTYKGIGFSWAKLTKSGAGFHMGLGYATRAGAEICLLATRGRPRRLNRDVRQLVVERIRAHSQKPDRVRDDIVRLYGGPYLELFARSRASGWDVALSDEPDLFGVAA
jgi:site-specific DNA-methyltransferase (adenine-specific)